MIDINIKFDTNNIKKYNEEDRYIVYEVEYILECKNRTITKKEDIFESLEELESYNLFPPTSDYIEDLSCRRFINKIEILSDLEFNYNLTINIFNYYYSEIPF